jgi:hypothetical protein
MSGPAGTSDAHLTDWKACPVIINCVLTIPALAVVVALVVRCSTATSPLIRAYDIVFHEDSETFYVPPSQNCGGYCKAWRSSSLTVGGSLRYTGQFELTIDQQTYAAARDSVHFDSVATYFTRLENDEHVFVDDTCHGVEVRVVASDGKLGGTWTEVTDCHGARRVGILLGQ